MISFRRLGRGLATISLLCLVSAPVAGAISTGSIGGRPANPDPNNPRTQSIFIMTLDRGQSKEDVILVANNSDVKRSVELYAVDGMVSNTGAYTCRQESEDRIGMGKWIDISKKFVELGPGDSTEVSFKVSLPNNADVGEHNGCIVFQSPEDAPAETGNVRIQTRQAIRVVATVPGDLHREVSIASFEVGKQNGNPLYSLSVKNEGNVSADVDAFVTVKSLFGREVYSNGGGYPVLSNQKLDLNFEQTENRPMFGGWYNVSASVKYDKNAGTFGTGKAQDLIELNASTKTIFIAPTTAGMLIIASGLIVLAGIVGYLLLRRHNTRVIKENGHKHVVDRGETVQSIANEYGVDWKKIVSVNKIKAPYTLMTGQTLRVPRKKKTNPGRNASARRR